MLELGLGLVLGLGLGSELLRALRHDRWEGGHTRHKGPIVTGDVAGAGSRQLVVDGQAVGVTCGEGHLVRVRVGPGLGVGIESGSGLGSGLGLGI